MGALCELHNACEANENDCHASAICSSTGVGTHDCTCSANTWGDGQSCTDWTTCIQGATYETSAPSTTTDRVCGPVTVCEAGQKTIRAATLDLDRRCLECSSGTYQPDGTASDCPACQPGTADLDEDPSTPCDDCLVGSEQVAASQTTCTTCPENWHDDDSDPATACVARPCADRKLQHFCCACTCAQLDYPFAC